MFGIRKGLLQDPKPAKISAENSHHRDWRGSLLRGREEFEKYHLTMHETIFRKSTLSITSTGVRFIRPDIAVSHVKWKLVGDNNPDGTPREPRTGIFTQVLVKSASKWLILASQNTNDARPTGKLSVSFFSENPQLPKHNDA